MLRFRNEFIALCIEMVQHIMTICFLFPFLVMPRSIAKVSRSPPQDSQVPVQIPIGHFPFAIVLLLLHSVTAGHQNEAQRRGLSVMASPILVPGPGPGDCR